MQRRINGTPVAHKRKEKHIHPPFLSRSLVNMPNNIAICVRRCQGFVIQTNATSVKMDRKRVLRVCLCAFHWDWKNMSDYSFCFLWLTLSSQTWQDVFEWSMSIDTECYSSIICTCRKFYIRKEKEFDMLYGNLISMIVRWNNSFKQEIRKA